jgi:hypothetical protein
VKDLQLARGHMFQGGENALQAICGEFDSH